MQWTPKKSMSPKLLSMKTFNINTICTLWLKGSKTCNLMVGNKICFAHFMIFGTTNHIALVFGK